MKIWSLSSVGRELNEVEMCDVETLSPWVVDISGLQRYASSSSSVATSIRKVKTCMVIDLFFLCGEIEEAKLRSRLADREGAERTTSIYLYSIRNCP